MKYRDLIGDIVFITLVILFVWFLCSQAFADLRDTFQVGDKLSRFETWKYASYLARDMGNDDEAIITWISEDGSSMKLERYEPVDEDGNEIGTQEFMKRILKAVEK